MCWRRPAAIVEAAVIGTGFGRPAVDGLKPSRNDVHPLPDIASRFSTVLQGRAARLSGRITIRGPQV